MWDGAQHGRFIGSNAQRGEMRQQLRQQRFWRRFFYIVLVEPAQFFGVEGGRGAVHIVDAEILQHIVNAENFLVAVRPAKAHQIVQDCRWQVAFATVIEDVGRAVPLRQALAVVAENHRHVRKFRHVVSQRAVEVNLFRRVADVVFAANDQ